MTRRVAAMATPSLLSVIADRSYPPSPSLLLPAACAQDGDVPEVTDVIDDMRTQFASRHPDVPFTHLRHPPVPGLAGQQFAGYLALSQHFGWALNHLFNQQRHPFVIVLEVRCDAGMGCAGAPPVMGLRTPMHHRRTRPPMFITHPQDDLEIAVDFFDYFTATEPLLKEDDTLLAVRCVGSLQLRASGALAPRLASRQLPRTFSTAHTQRLERSRPARLCVRPVCRVSQRFLPRAGMDD